MSAIATPIRPPVSKRVFGIIAGLLLALGALTSNTFDITTSGRDDIVDECASVAAATGVFIVIPTAKSANSYWDCILAPERAADWTDVGIPGGIPVRTTICETINDTYTTAQIQTAANNCPVDQVLFFSAGTYTINDEIEIRKAIILRGAGPDSTQINFTSGAGRFCIGMTCAGNGLGSPGYISGQTAISWTGGLTRGSTQLTVSDTTGLSAGQFIIMDEENPAWIDTVGQSGSPGSCGRNDSPDQWDGGLTRCTGQHTKIVSVDSGTQITVKDEVAYDHSSGLNPEIFYMSSSHVEYGGVEDMSIDVNQTNFAISFVHCDYCWVKNVRLDDVQRAGVLIRNSYGNVVRESYISSTSNPGPTLYGIECFRGWNFLVENNIFFNNTSQMQIQDCGKGVVAYNYVRDEVSANGNLFPSIDTHAVHNEFLLYEGNDNEKFQYDNVWGSSSHNTMFRNRANGRSFNKTNDKQPMGVMANNWYINIVANVLGEEGQHVNYQCDDVVQPASNTYIYVLGTWNNCGEFAASYDSNVIPTLMRWGNWDADTYAENGDTNGIRYCTGAGVGNAECTVDETASADTVFPGLASPITSFPDSFYLSAKPSWFGSVVWPPIGPDVTCTTDCDTNAGGHVEKIPARLCYESSAKDGNGYLTSFDPDTCY